LRAHVFAWAVFDNLSQKHDRDVRAQVAHHSQVVADEDRREMKFPLHILQKIDNLRLNGNVQRRDWFVCDDELGIERNCSSDPHALSLPTGQLVGQVIIKTSAKSDEVQDLAHASPTLIMRHAVRHQRFPDNILDGAARIQRSVRILKYWLHMPTQLSEFLPPNPRDVLPHEVYAAAVDIEQT